MSPSPRGVVRPLLLALASVAALSAAPSAHAAPTPQATFDLTCRSWLLDFVAPATLRVSGFPDSAPVNKVTPLEPSWEIRFDDPKPTTALETLGAAAFDGTSSVAAAFEESGRSERAVSFRSAIPTTAVGAPLTATGTGKVSVTFTVEGPITYSVGTAFALNVRPRDADGNAIPLPVRETPDVDGGEAWEEPDSDESTAGIRCTLNAGQDRVVHVGHVGTPPRQTYAFGVSGVAAMRTVSPAAIPLGGSLKLETGAGGVVTAGEMSLDPVRVPLKTALAGIPLTAKLELLRVGAPTGSLVAGRLEIQQQLRVRLSNFVLGTSPLLNSATCLARAASTVKLVSDSPVTAAGGSLVGSFALSDLAGCAPLNGLFDARTSSTGNSIRLLLKP